MGEVTDSGDADPPVAASRKPLDAKAIRRIIRKLVPRSLPNLGELADFLEALQIPIESAVSPAAARAAQILVCNGWLAAFVTKGDHREFVSSLRQIAGSKAAKDVQSSQSWIAPDFQTVIGRGDPKIHLERLRAVHLLAWLLTKSLDPGDRLNVTDIRVLGGVIRRLDLRAASTFGTAGLESAGKASSLNEIGSRVAQDLETQSSDLAKRWPEIWMPWIDRISARAEGTTPIESDPPDETPEPSSWTTPVDKGGEEPGVELPPILLPPYRPKGVPAPSPAFVAAFSDQAIRSRNLELSKEHIEVATDVEIRIVVRYCRQTLRSPRSASDWDLAPTLLLLQIVTGRTLATIADAYILPAKPPAGERHLVIDLQTGLISCPVLEPRQIYRPSLEHPELFEARASTIVLALPKVVLDFLQRMYAWRKVERVVDWFDKADPEQRVLSFLKAVPELPSAIYRSSAPFRRWLPCQLQEVGGDIAKTMLIVGQTFGRSSGPLYYFAPKQSDLMALYRTALSEFLSFAATEPAIAQSGNRVGPACLTKFDVARTGVGRIGRRLSLNAEKAFDNLESAIRYHNALTDYLSHYIAIISSHRPTDELYSLTRRHFDLRNHIAIFRDKPQDPEHFTRLVAITPDLSENIAFYLCHLRRLCARWGTDNAKRMAEAIIAGDIPFLKYLDEAGELRKGTLNDFRRGSAECWTGLPDNWYRPLLSMGLRENGAQPLTVHAQLGHLEAASHPFLEDSVLAPMDVADAVRPALIRHERNLGFRVVPGFSGGQLATEPPLYLRWTTALQKHDSELRSIARAQASLLRAHLKGNRQAATAWLLSVLEEVSPTLLTLINAVRKTRAHGSSLIDPSLKNMDVADQDIEEILARNEADHGNNPARRIAVHNLFCRWLRSAASDAKASVIDIGLVNLSPRAELSPLLADNCSATEQIGALREWFETSVRSGKSFQPQIVRTLGLVLYEGLRDAEEILELSKFQGKPITFFAQGSVVCMDLPGRRGPVTISGLAALPLSCELSDGEPATTTVALNRQLTEILPHHLRPADSDQTLGYWATTSQIASRIEKSGLFRYASDRKGILEAPAAQQAAFLSKRFPAHERSALPDSNQDAKLELNALHNQTPQARQRRDSSTVSTTTWHRLKRVNKAIRSPTKVFADFKQSPPRVSSDFQQATLTLVDLALNLCEPPDNRGSDLDIVMALADFARDLCVTGTRKRTAPAVGTIRTYFHDLARDLLDTFGGVDLRSLDEEDFDSAYELFKACSVGKRSAARRSMALADFHDFLVQAYGLPVVIVPWIGSALTDPRPDPTLLTEAQYLAARDYLLGIVDQSAPHSFAEATWRRIAYAAAVALILLRRSGARISEVVLLRQIDIWTAEDSVFIHIRPSLFRQLKTAAATRRIDLTARLDEVERRFLLAWFSSDSKVHDAGQRKTLLFPMLGEPDSPIGVPVLRQLIQEAFRIGAGVEMHPHQLRHLWLSEETDRLSRSLASNDSLVQRIRSFEEMRLGIGHARLRTGASIYSHTRAAFSRLQLSATTSRNAGRWTLAVLTGSNVRTVDKLRERFLTDDVANSECVWTDILFTQRGVSRTLSVSTHSSGLPPRLTIHHSPISVNNLDLYIRLLRDGHKPGSIGASFGFSSAMSQGIESAIRDLAVGPAHFRFLPSETRRKTVRKESLPRALNSGALMTMFRNASSTDIQRAATIFKEVYRPFFARRDVFVGCDDQLERLRRALMALGIDAGTITIKNGELSIRRDGRGVGLFHSVVWALAVIATYARLSKSEGFPMVREGTAA